jgi:hypothetical protein
MVNKIPTALYENSDDWTLGFLGDLEPETEYLDNIGEDSYE